MKKQAEIIANTLSKTYPENRGKYQKSLEVLLDKLDALDQEIFTTLRPMKNRTIMVSHPAFAYFCRDYNFVQLPIEFEGKEPSARQLTEILKKAKSADIKKVIVIQQLVGKGSRLVANHLNAKIIEVDVLSENYLENMRKIAKEIIDP
jgi:zinc transport system substrate-binding protein